MQIEDLKIKEVLIYLELIETKSVRELARRMGVQPSQITKAVQSLEYKLGENLLDRSIKGVGPSPQAKEFLPFLKGIQKYSEALVGHCIETETEEFFSFSTTSFFSTHLMPKVFSRIEAGHKGVRFRLIDLPPSQFIPVGMRGGFNYCVHMNSLDWPKTWESRLVGELKWVLCCRYDHPLEKKPRLNKVLKYPFVFPIYWADAGIKFGDDGCPAKISKRIKGHETSTATSAAKIIKGSDQLGFLPEVVVRDEVQRKELRTIHISSWPDVSSPIYLSVKADLVKKKWLEEFQTRISEELNCF